MSYTGWSGRFISIDGGIALKKDEGPELKDKTRYIGSSEFHSDPVVMRCES